MEQLKSNCKKRFIKGILGKKGRRVSVGNVVSIATTDLMDICGASFPDVHCDSNAMTDLAAAGHLICGFDSVMPIFSVVQEAAALGCEIDWGSKNTMPTVRSHPFAVNNSFEFNLDWQNQKPITSVLDSISQLRSNLGADAAIVGKVMGPWTLSYHLMGTEEFLINTAADVEIAIKSLDVLKDITLEFAKMQIRAGADVICLADHATGGMVSPQNYSKLLQPIHQYLCSQIGVPIVLHCCGDTSDRVHLFAESGFDCFHFESHVNLTKAKELVKGKISLMGNINNPEILLSSTSDIVYQKCVEAISNGVDVLSPECAVPLATPIENLKSMVSAAEDFAKAD